MDIYYINNKGQMLDLLHKPYRLQTGDIYDSIWYQKSGRRQKGLKKGTQEKNMLLSVTNRSKNDFYDAINNFADITEYDLIQETPGKLYIGKQYLNCYLTESRKTDWEYDINVIDVALKIVTDKPFWITEQKYEFIPDKEGKASTNEKVYDYTYDCYYPSEKEVRYIENDSVMDADFQMIIYGPRTTTNIRIGENIYNVDYLIQEGEYAVIDTREGIEEEKEFIWCRKMERR